MIKIDPPPQPTKYATDQDLQTARDQIKVLIDTAESKNGAGPYPKTDEFPPDWNSYQKDLAEAQSQKCAYCEAKPKAVAYGTLDHFRPKASSSEYKIVLSPKTKAGKIRKNPAKPKRVRLRTLQPGYWWLAYSWENWRFACPNCNTYKSDFFPTQPPHQKMSVGIELSETAMLIDPYHLDPENHFKFDELGNIEAQTNEGQIAIEVYQLQRQELTDARKDYCEKLLRTLDDLALSDNSEQSIRKLRDRLKEDAQPNKPFAGMVRYLIKFHTGRNWKDLF